MIAAAVVPPATARDRNSCPHPQNRYEPQGGKASAGPKSRNLDLTAFKRADLSHHSARRKVKNCFDPCFPNQCPWRTFWD